MYSYLEIKLKEELQQQEEYGQQSQQKSTM